ncbi:hypothetical protein KL912_005204 [Ogataea haglerorum]|nr:hypothetical protein KL912_005204 [Ogataea haglerorum]
MSRPHIPATVQAPFPLVIRNTSVVAGFGRGSAEMGIPTANVPVDDEPELQKLDTGVYFGFVRLLRPEQTPETKVVPRSDGKSEVEFTYGANLADSDFEVQPMVMSLGWNPFFKNSKKACELHILHEFRSTFYGCRLNFNILGYVRPELDYVSMEALIKDIQLDIETARKYLAMPEYANGDGQHLAEPERVQNVQDEICRENDDGRRRHKPRVVSRGVQVQGQSVDLVPAPADSCAEKGRDQQHVVGQREPLGHELGELESDPAQVQKRRRNFKEQENRAVVVDHLGADARQKDGAGHDAVDQKAQPKVLQMAQRHRRVPHKIARGQRAVHFRVRRGRKNAVLVEVFVVEKRDRQHHDQRRLDEGHDPHAEVEPVDFFGDQRPHSGQQTKQPAHQIQAVVEQHTEHQHVQDLQQLAARAVWHNGVQERDPDGNRNAVLARCPKIRNEIHGKVLPCARRALG